jgi:hypothetical protein
MIVFTDRLVFDFTDCRIQYDLLQFALTDSGMVGTILEVISEAASFEPCFQVGYHLPHRTYYTLWAGADVLDIPRH